MLDARAWCLLPRCLHPSEHLRKARGAKSFPMRSCASDFKSLNHDLSVGYR